MDLSFKKVFTDFQKYLSDNEFEHDIINKKTAQERNVIKNIILPYFDLEKLTTQTHNFKSKILEWAQKEKISINFIVEKTSKSSRLSEFKSILKIDGKNISTGYGKSKKNAEKDASRIACEKLQLG